MSLALVTNGRTCETPGLGLVTLGFVCQQDFVNVVARLVKIDQAKDPDLFIQAATEAAVIMAQATETGISISEMTQTAVSLIASKESGVTVAEVESVVSIVEATMQAVTIEEGEDL